MAKAPESHERMREEMDAIELLLSMIGGWNSEAASFQITAGPTFEAVKNNDGWHWNVTLPGIGQKSGGPFTSLKKAKQDAQGRLRDRRRDIGYNLSKEARVDLYP